MSGIADNSRRNGKGSKMTTRTKHTLGPWRAYIGRKQADGSKPKSSGTVWTKENNILIASSLHSDDGERAANARLIAAAPDLVAALADCLPDLEHYAATHGPGPDRRLHAARAALAKAGA